MTDTRTLLNRRGFLQTALGAGAGVALAGPFAALGARAAGAAAGGPPRLAYGPLAPVRDQTTGLELLNAAEGFRVPELRLAQRCHVGRHADAKQPRRDGGVP